jgi:hypothetical protein
LPTATSAPPSGAAAATPPAGAIVQVLVTILIRTFPSEGGTCGYFAIATTVTDLSLIFEIAYNNTDLTVDVSGRHIRSNLS